MFLKELFHWRKEFEFLSNQKNLVDIKKITNSLIEIKSYIRSINYFIEIERNLPYWLEKELGEFLQKLNEEFYYINGVYKWQI